MTFTIQIPFFCCDAHSKETCGWLRERVWTSYAVASYWLGAPLGCLTGLLAVGEIAFLCHCSQDPCMVCWYGAMVAGTVDQVDGDWLPFYGANLGEHFEVSNSTWQLIGFLCDCTSHGVLAHQVNGYHSTDLSRHRFIAMVCLK